MNCIAVHSADLAHELGVRFEPTAELVEFFGGTFDGDDFVTGWVRERVLNGVKTDAAADFNDDFFVGG